MRTASIDAVLKNFYVIILCEELAQIGSESHCEASTKGLALMEKFATYYGLKLSHLIF